MPNEFDDLDTVPENSFSEDDNTQQDVYTGQEDLIDARPAGVVYDFKNAPKSTKQPPRTDLNGKEVVIELAEIILPPVDKPWLKTKKGDKECKPCTFALHYNEGGQVEFFSGIRVFKREVDGKAKYSHPTITRDRVNQASELLGLYADFKKKNINEVSLFEFMSFLNSKPKAIIKSQDIKNPMTNQIVKKNMIEKFI
jgi:hypothetical protein